jgi:fatty acid-binding protein DegV
MDKLSELRAHGKTIDEVRDFVEEHKLNLNHWFFTSDLTFFIKGGMDGELLGCGG